MFSVEQYGQRHFAVYGRTEPAAEPELVAVTVYRKGARRVADLLNQARQTITTMQRGADSGLLLTAHLNGNACPAPAWQRPWR